MTLDAVAPEKVHGNCVASKEKTVDGNVSMDATGLMHHAAGSVDLTKAMITPPKV